MAFNYKGNLVINPGATMPLHIPTSEPSVLDLEWSIEDAQDVDFSVDYQSADDGTKSVVLPPSRLSAKQHSSEDSIDVAGPGTCVLTWNHCYGGWLGASAVKLSYSATVETKRAILEEQQRLQREAEARRVFQEERRRRMDRDERIRELEATAKSSSQAAAGLRRTYAEKADAFSQGREQFEDLSQDLEADEASLAALHAQLAVLREELEELERERDAEAPLGTSSPSTNPGLVAEETSGASGPSPEEDFVEVVLDKTEDASLGMNVIYSDDLSTLFVKAVTGGLISAWNQQNPGKEVTPGSCIVEINGVGGDANEILGQCKINQVLRMKVLRPTTTAEVADSGAPTSTEEAGQRNDVTAESSPGSAPQAGEGEATELPPCAEAVATDAPPVENSHAAQAAGAAESSSTTCAVEVQEENLRKDQMMIVLDRRDGSSVGARLECSEGHGLVVKSVIGGLMAAWNESHSGDEEILPGDRIVEVNGVTGDVTQMIDECKKNQVLNITIQRAPATSEDCVVRIDKTGGESLGARLDLSDPHYLVILGIAGGPMGAWNELHPGSEIKPGCRIVEVNGVGGDAQQMLEECKKRQVLEFKIVQGEDMPEEAEQGSGAVSSAAAPDTPNGKVIVSLDRTSGESLGVTLDVSQNRLVVKGIAAGLVADWNDAHPDRAVQPGSEIVEVNGVRGDVKQMLEECRRQHMLKVTFRPAEATEPAVQEDPGEILVAVDKADCAMFGATLDFSNADSLVIKSVDGGLLGRWNDTHPGQEVKAGSRIVEVNGVQGDSKQLLDEMKTNQKLDVRILRGAMQAQAAHASAVSTEQEDDGGATESTASSSGQARSTVRGGAEADEAGQVPDNVDEEIATDDTDELVERDFVHSNGSRYKGQWKGGKYHGKGELIRSDGAAYVGEFVAGKAHGVGKFTGSSGHTYEGQWFQDLAHGEGLYCDVAGLSYQGQWQSNEKSGHGVQRWEDGSAYEGQFKEGRKHGQGSYMSKEGQPVYQGEFHNDKMHGQGRHVYSDGRVYDGQWRGGLNYGDGVMQWADGSKYTGGFVQGRRHGEGTLRWADGRQYKGQWHSGKQHGTIVATDSTGREQQLTFSHGNLVVPEDPPGAEER